MFDQFSSDPQENLLSSVGLTSLNSNLSPENAVIVPTSGLSPEKNLNQPVTVNPADSLLLPGIGGADTAGAVTLVDNQSSDALTGEAMNIAKGKLIELAQAPDFIEKMNIPFGDNWNTEVANTLKQNWLKGDFNSIPPVEIVSKGDIAGANGAFAQTTNTIYLSQKFLRENGTNSQAVADVLLEEIGHSIDSKINVTDSPGDEGEIFAGIVQGNEWSQFEIQELRGDEDGGIATIDGQTISIEKAIDWTNQWGGKVFDWSSGKTTYITPKWIPFTRNNKIDGASYRNAISRNWGNKNPFSNYGLRSSDKFGVTLRTQADFEAGVTYNFSVKADDFYNIRAIPVNANFNKNEWVYIGTSIIEYNEMIMGEQIQRLAKSTCTHVILIFS